MDGDLDIQMFGYIERLDRENRVKRRCMDGWVDCIDCLHIIILFL